MASHTPNLKQDIQSVLAWSLVTPALALWPFISAAPAFKLLAGVETSGDAALQLAFLATGFWSVFAIFAAAEYARNRTVKLMPSKYGNGNGLIFGAYATVWTAVYGLVMFVMR